MLGLKVEQLFVFAPGKGKETDLRNAEEVAPLPSYESLSLSADVGVVDVYQLSARELDVVKSIKSLLPRISLP